MLEQEHVSGGVFAARMLPAWLASIAVVIVVLAVVHRKGLRGGDADGEPRSAVRIGPGAFGVVGAVVLVLVLANPALPVLALAVVLGVWARIEPRTALAAASPTLLAGVSAVAVALGTLARSIGSLADLTQSTGRWTTALLGAGAAGS